MEVAQRDRVLAFRLGSHNLTRRLPATSILEAAAACGIQETPVGSAGVAFAARLRGSTAATVERALLRDRTLLSLWSVRGAPFIVPARDLPVFSVGAMPVDTNSFKQSLGGWAGSLDEAGLDPFETLQQMIDVAGKLLDGRTLNVNELRDLVYARVPSLSAVKRPAGAHADMPEPLFRALGTSGTVCIVAGRGTESELARTDQWLRSAPVRTDRTLARSELARRFLHCYGPATAQHFAQWTQRSLGDAKEAFSLIEHELIAVEVARTKAWILERDQKVLSSPPRPDGVRLLPFQDPFLQQRDRATLLPKEASRRRLWQPVRGPGGVLMDGELVGTWRGRTKGARLELSVEPFARLPRAARGAIAAEAELIAPLRACRAVDIRYLA